MTDFEGLNPRDTVEVRWISTLHRFKNCKISGISSPASSCWVYQSDSPFLVELAEGSDLVGDAILGTGMWAEPRDIHCQGRSAVRGFVDYTVCPAAVLAGSRY